jgi:hypothetical protein
MKIFIYLDTGTYLRDLRVLRDLRDLRPFLRPALCVFVNVVCILFNVCSKVLIFALRFPNAFPELEAATFAPGRFHCVRPFVCSYQIAFGVALFLELYARFHPG